MKIKATQQTIVFGLFLLMFTGFALFLRGFAQVDNLLTLLQNVAILGILGLGMAVVVIGRGIDISMIATLAVPSGLLLQLVANGQAYVAFAHAHSHTVVTHERSQPNAKKRILIPDACTAIGVNCVDPFTMLRSEGAKFVCAN